MTHTPIMTPEQQWAYVLPRKFHPDAGIRDEQLRTLRNISIHNGYGGEEVRDVLRRARVQYIEYVPAGSAEEYFWTETNDLHIYNARCETRLRRDLEQCGVIRGRLPKVGVEEIHYGSDRNIAGLHLRDFGFELARSIFERVRQEGPQHRNVCILTGPHDAVPLERVTDVEAPSNQNRDYLKWRTFRIGEQLVINLDYIFGDQASIVLGELYRRCNNEFPERSVDINVFHYGKVGGIGHGLTLRDICVPTHVKDEENILLGRTEPHPLFNQLAFEGLEREIFQGAFDEKTPQGISVNTASVLAQTRENLQMDRAAGGSFLEMEWLYLSNFFPSTFRNIRGFNLHLAGAVSDLPLAGDTLATGVDLNDGFRRIVGAYLTIIEETGRKKA
jgi:hypothetical protein